MTDKLIQSTQHRRDVFRTLLLIISLGGISFFFINIYRELYFLAVFELLYSFYSIFILSIITSSQYFQRWVLAYIIPLFTLILYALTLPETSNSIFMWILAFPIVSYLLLGKKWGLKVSLFFISAGLAVYHFRFITSLEAVNISDSFNIIFSSALMISFAHVYEKNRELNEIRLLDLAGTDSLTNLPNRLKLYESFSRWNKKNNDNEAILSVALIDLDFFKKINDQYGHSVGDDALRHVSNFIIKRKRDQAIFARIGGEEFALKVIGASLNDCHQYINELRIELSQSPLITHNNIKINITFSAGISTYGEDGTTLDALLANADKRLYVAKNNGRNCVMSSNQLINEDATFTI